MATDNKRINSLNVNVKLHPTLKRNSTFHNGSTADSIQSQSSSSRVPSPALISRSISHTSPTTPTNNIQQHLIFYKVFNTDITDTQSSELFTSAFRYVLSDRYTKLLSQLSTILHCNTNDVVYKRNETAMCIVMLLNGQLESNHHKYKSGDILGNNEWIHHIANNTQNNNNHIHNDNQTNNDTNIMRPQQRLHDATVTTNDTYIALLRYDDLHCIEQLLPDLYNKLIILCLQQQYTARSNTSIPPHSRMSNNTFLYDRTIDENSDHTATHHRRNSSLSSTREMHIAQEKYINELHTLHKYEYIYRQVFSDELHTIHSLDGTCDLLSQPHQRITVRNRAIPLNEDTVCSTSEHTVDQNARSSARSQSHKSDSTNKQQRELAFLKQKCSRHDEVIADRDALINTLQSELKSSSEIQSKYNKLKHELHTLHNKQAQLEGTLNESKKIEVQRVIQQQAELVRQHHSELISKQQQIDTLHKNNNELQSQLIESQQLFTDHIQQVKQLQQQSSDINILQQQYDTLQSEHNTLQQTYASVTTAYDNIVQQLRIKLGESERKLSTVIQWKQQAMVYADEWSHERSKLKKKLIRAHEQLSMAQHHCVNYRIILQRLAIKQYVIQFKAKRELHVLYQRIVHLTTDSLAESQNDKSLGESAQNDSSSDIELRVSQKLHQLPWCKRRNTTPLIEFIESICSEIDVLQQTQHTVHEQKYKWRFTANIFFHRNIELTNTYIQHDKLLETTNTNIHTITQHSKTLADKYNELNSRLKSVTQERDDALKSYRNEIKKQLHLDSDTQKQEQSQFNRTVLLQRKCRSLQQQCETLLANKSKLQSQLDSLQSDRVKLSDQCNTLQSQSIQLQQKFNTVCESTTGQSYIQLQQNIQLTDALNRQLPLNVLSHVTNTTTLPTRTLKTAPHHNSTRRVHTSNGIAVSKPSQSALPAICMTQSTYPHVNNYVSREKQELDDVLKQMSIGHGNTEFNVTT